MFGRNLVVFRKCQTLKDLPRFKSYSSLVCLDTGFAVCTELIISRSRMPKHASPREPTRFRMQVLCPIVVEFQFSRAKLTARTVNIGMEGERAGVAQGAESISSWLPVMPATLSMAESSRKQLSPIRKEPEDGKKCNRVPGRAGGELFSLMIAILPSSKRREEESLVDLSQRRAALVRHSSVGRKKVRSFVRMRTTEKRQTSNGVCVWGEQLHLTRFEVQGGARETRPPPQGGGWASEATRPRDLLRSPAAACVFVLPNLQRGRGGGEKSSLAIQRTSCSRISASELENGRACAAHCRRARQLAPTTDARKFALGLCRGCCAWWSQLGVALNFPLEHSALQAAVRRRLYGYSSSAATVFQRISFQCPGEDDENPHNDTESSKIFSKFHQHQGESAIPPTANEPRTTVSGLKRKPSKWLQRR